MPEPMNGTRPVVATRAGRVAGTWRNGIAEFRAIPYAAAPVGALRFSPPEPRPAWDGVYEAASAGPAPPQPKAPGEFAGIFSTRLPTGEDCLRLNVWTPDPGAAGLPVLVWIHGGGFMIGSGAEPYYDGATFARDGVVCVSINYRLGILGYLYSQTEGAGNFGTLDQIAALRWVQENIAAFGGDPDRVTVAGESAGGMAVGILLAAPAARGLFRRAIAQSGAAHHGISLDSSRRVAEQFCALVAVEREDSEALRALDAAGIVAAQERLFGDVVASGDVNRYGAEVIATGMPFQPAIGGDVLDRRAIEIVAAGGARGVDLMVGYTSEEFRLFLGVSPAPITFEEVLGAYEAAFPGRGGENYEIYRRNRPHADPSELMAALATDRMFRVPAVRLADAQSNHNRSTFCYRLSWRSPAFGGRIGAGHGIDVPLVWQCLDDPLAQQLLGPSPPLRLAQDMHSAWVAFVAAGDPSHPAIPDWPHYSSALPAVMDFDEPTRVLLAPGADEVALWEDLIR